MLVAIHQPNFLPWLGYFDKLARADVFVVLDCVPLQRTGGAYTNRAQILIRGKPAWITMPVARDADLRRRIDRARIVEDGAWRKRLTETIRQHYARAASFHEVMPVVERIMGTATDSLRDFNLAAIRTLAEWVGLDTAKILLASELDVSGRATDLLVSIVRAVGGTAYLVGGGAGGYQEDEKFHAAGIDLRLQRFQPLPYPQLRTTAFVPGLSIVDALMNCGAARTAALIGHPQGASV
jgi:hypothetical protein